MLGALPGAMDLAHNHIEGNGRVSNKGRQVRNGPGTGAAKRKVAPPPPLAQAR